MLDIVPMSDWPERDQAAWQMACRPGDPLDDPGPIANRGHERTGKFRAAYGRWLGFLAERGIDIRAQTGLDQFTRETVTAFVRRLEADLAPRTVRSHLTDLDTVVRSMAPDRDVETLRGATRHLWRRPKSVTDKRGRLVASHDLYKFGFDLMARAERRSTPLQAAGDFRDGLVIALLAARPIRRRNLAGIEIDRQLTREGDCYWLSFSAEETKTRRALEFPLPETLTDPMDTYLSRCRPYLAARDGRWKDDPGKAVWVSGDGSRLKAGRMHRRICDRTRERFRHPINPHLFRDVAATSIAIEDPAHVGIILAILGHSTIRTSETYYNQATGIEAVRHYQSVIAGFR